MNYRLGRLPFAIGLIAHNTLIYSLDEESVKGVLIILLSSLLYVLFILVPRLRDLDLKWWWCFLSFIPILGFGMGIALLFFPGKLLNRRDSIEEVAEEDALAKSRSEDEDWLLKAYDKSNFLGR